MIQKIRPRLHFVGFVIVVCAFLDVCCQIYFYNFDALHMSYARMLIAISIIGLLMGALSPSALIACLASVISVALGIALYYITFLSTGLEIFFYKLGGIYWLCVQLLVGGLSGLIGRHLVVLLSDLRERRAVANETAQTTKLHEQGPRRRVTGIAWLWPAIYALVIFVIVFGHWLMVNKIATESKEGKQWMDLIRRIINLEYNAKEIYSAQKESPTEANIRRKEVLTRLKKDEKQYLLSHPKEFPNAYRMFSNSIKENNRNQSGTPTH